ncbi:MAG: 2-phospho-L-lactate guanylyltransferase [Polyangiaceae bacterium]|nr:2-phospho-L-lactate guanylyltransferase [Polyangiaceae bacterium]MCW5791337.1 2-phospho-L-lactate guanylyltransferase [Polyangiaceae bacterium]
MRLWAVVPIKGFAEAKSRLGPALPEAERRAFAEELATHVLSVLSEHPRVNRTLVATNSAEVAALARRLGAEVRPDAPGEALSQVIDRALAHAAARGASHGLVVMGDLPRLSGAALDALIQALERGPVAVPDRHQVATNALGLPLPTEAPTAFGTGESLALHRARFQELTLLSLAEVEHDVDLPSDLAR